MPTAVEIQQRFPRLFVRAEKDAPAVLQTVLAQRMLAPGEHLLDPSVESDALYLVWSGQLGVRVNVDGKRLHLGEIGAGAWVGDVTFIEGGAPTAQVTAAEPTTVLELDRAAFDALQTSHPAVARAILHGVCSDLSARLRASSDLLWTMSGGTGGQVADPDTEDDGWLRRAWRRLQGGGEA